MLLRADYNVPIEDGKVMDDYRLTQSLPTLEYLLKQQCKLIICSHLGRPDGKVDPKLSLAPVAKHLQKLLDHKVTFVSDCVGPKVAKAVAAMKPGDILMLENVRFHPEEEANDPQFAKELASYAEVFVQDAFGVVHHGAVSVSEIPKYIPGVAGFLLEKEVDTITDVMHNPKRPLVAVVGGAKIADKIDILHRFIEVSDFLAVGGAMANTFLKAQGVDVEASLYDKDELGVAKDIMAKAGAETKKRRFVLYVPQDAVVAHKVDRSAGTRIVDFSAHVIADIENYPKRPPAAASHMYAHEMILDIGPFTGAFIAGALQQAETVVWNGAMGVTEVDGLQGPIGPFAHGTDLVMEAMLGQWGNRPFSVVGGGDTVGYIENRGLVKAFDHVSTGGGASLELMAGRKLPGVEALLDKGGVA